MRSGIRNGYVFGSEAESGAPSIGWKCVVCRRRVDECTADDSPQKHPSSLTSSAASSAEALPAHPPSPRRRRRHTDDVGNGTHVVSMNRTRIANALESASVWRLGRVWTEWAGVRRVLSGSSSSLEYFCR